ncbi:hypothetical protein NDU88_003505 [Pleurodeles waltl]|uniref:Uncharacterized protein n=1 Tax=Pleurodeles waltl TaxID=8319 RepID=A0AAV7UC86_PLEWA|nr:hypothetical protein NDU88_003505 [Pleurodeles waltl]
MVRWRGCWQGDTASPASARARGAVPVELVAAAPARPLYPDSEGAAPPPQQGLCPRDALRVPRCSSESLRWGPGVRNTGRVSKTLRVSLRCCRRAGRGVGTT